MKERRKRVHVSMFCPFISCSLIIFGTLASVSLAPDHIWHSHFIFGSLLWMHTATRSRIHPTWTGPTFVRSFLLLVSVSPPHAFAYYSRCYRVEFGFVGFLLHFGLSPDLHFCSRIRDDGLMIFCSYPGLEK